MIVATASTIRRLRHLGLIAGLIGLVGLGLCALGLRLDAVAFFRAYLPACLCWTSLSLGALAILMIHHLTGGRWGVFVDPVLRATAGLLPLLALLFVPLAFGLEDLYAWVRPPPDLAATVQKKAAYLNVPFFLGRTGVEFALWVGLAAALGVWSRAPFEALDAARRQGWSAAGLILFGLTVTVYGMDWVMSLEPRWYSSSFGLLANIGPMVGALAFATAVSATLVRTDAPTDEAARDRLQDLGNLLLAGILLWTYLGFNQYLTIWSENLPDKTLWYLERSQGGWPRIALLLAACHFALPFLALLSRRVKRSPAALLAVATLALFGRLVDVYWLVLPTFREHSFDVHWLDAAALFGVGGVWLGAFAWSFARLLAAGPDATPRQAVRKAVQHG